MLLSTQGGRIFSVPPKKMNFVFYTNIISPHQVPWCMAFVDLVGQDKFYYVITDGEYLEREKLGWQVKNINFNVLTVNNATELLEHADILISGIRDVALFKLRGIKGLKTFYVSERWFKPPLGMLRLIVPTYWLMCCRFFNLLTRNAGGKCELMLLPIGIHAARDMARMIGLLSGDIRCLWQTPEVKTEERVPLSRLRLSDRTINVENNCTSWTKDELGYGLGRMRLWGYFVKPTSISNHKQEESDKDKQLIQSEKGARRKRNFRILWVGRMLNWKRIDTLVLAVVHLLNEGIPINLKIVGHGPVEGKLRQMAGYWLIENAQLTGEEKISESHVDNLSSDENQGIGISFHPPVKITEVRKLMQEADVYVFPSDGGEGWGAVVNEAMAEGCCVIGTHEAGSSATIIEDGINGYLFHAGDVRALVECLRKVASVASTGNSICKQAERAMDEGWNPQIAARKLFDFITQEDNGSECNRS